MREMRAPVECRIADCFQRATLVEGNRNKERAFVIVVEIEHCRRNTRYVFADYKRHSAAVQACIPERVVNRFDIYRIVFDSFERPAMSESLLADFGNAFGYVHRFERSAGIERALADNFNLSAENNGYDICIVPESAVRNFGYGKIEII